MRFVGIVAHDAGGAEILSSWVAHNPDNYLFSLQGPAMSIFKRKLGDLQICSLDELVANSEYVITGTSSESAFELDAISCFRKQKKKSISFLDHWINYLPRFSRGLREITPDEIWAGDELAFRIASEAFPRMPINLVPNWYVHDLIAEANSQQGASGFERAGGPTKILFVGENISGAEKSLFHDLDRHHQGNFNEIDCLQYLISNYTVLSEIPAIIRIRPHPSENVEKYMDVAKFSQDKTFDVEVSNDNLVVDLVWAEIVCGMSSMALYLALKLNKKVVCCIPGIQNKSKLPHEGIEYLSKLILE